MYVLSYPSCTIIIVTVRVKRIQNTMHRQADSTEMFLQVLCEQCKPLPSDNTSECMHYCEQAQQATYLTLKVMDILRVPVWVRHTYIVSSHGIV